MSTLIQITKISKGEAGYVDAVPSHYWCCECAYIGEDGRCTDYIRKDAAVASYGGCNDWKDLRLGRIVGLRNATRETTAYMENPVGFSCKRCEEFEGRTERCKKVSEKGNPVPGRIDPNGCCNFWEKDPVEGNKEDVEFVYRRPRDLQELFSKVIR